MMAYKEHQRQTKADLKEMDDDPGFWEKVGGVAFWVVTGLRYPAQTVEGGFRVG
jgi:hypothetical protein